MPPGSRIVAFGRRGRPWCAIAQRILLDAGNGAAILLDVRARRWIAVHSIGEGFAGDGGARHLFGADAPVHFGFTATGDLDIAGSAFPQLKPGHVER